MPGLNTGAVTLQEVALQAAMAKALDHVPQCNPQRYMCNTPDGTILNLVDFGYWKTSAAR